MVKNTIKYELDGVCFELREEYDFNWLKKFGTVFRVFDQQDSGNICFGVKRGSDKLFIKYAGVKTLNYDRDINTAVENLKRTSNIYKDLKCDQLIKLKESFETDNGYGVVFEWIEGENLHEHWNFDKYPKYTHPKSAYYRYKKLPIDKRIKSINEIFKFLLNVEQLGYVAVDLYDGSIMYDFDNHITKICDIDLFRKKPTINDIGKDFWGSKRFKSPEEYILNSPIDEKTNVFNLGALIFGILGYDKDHSYEKWEASKELYHIVVKAINPNREERYKSVSDFYSYFKL